MTRGFIQNEKLYITLIFMTLLISILVVPKWNTQVNALENGLARTPPMGWNSWNKFGYNVTESLVKGIADAMVSSGMKDAGYQYVVMDDAWMSRSRDSSGNLVPDPAKFPNGIKAVADYVHSKGLKIGIYEDAGTATCGGWPGSYGHYQQDANLFASWGIDYLKFDWCNASGLTQKTQYTQMRDALSTCGRPICFSICEWGTSQPWTWGESVGNLWRTTGDISDNWSSFLSILDKQVNLYSYAGPGHWNDPDMLEVGNGGMTTTEYQAHFSLWCLLAAPLMAGNDLRSMSTTTRDILTNTEVIAVDQDPNGIQGQRVRSSGGLEVWFKPLSDGSRAVVLFNRNTSAASITVNWSEIGISGSAQVRDLWAHAERGTFTNSYSASVAGHGCVMVKITGASVVTPTPTQRVTGTSYEAESTSNIIAGACVKAALSGASGGYVVGYVGNGSANYLQFNNVNVPTTGSYPITIYYVSGEARSASMSINGGTGASISFPASGSGWTTVGSLTITVTLNAGNNTIRFSNSTAYAPDFDRIVVPGGTSATPTPTRRVTPTPTPTQSATPTPTSPSTTSYEAEASGNTIAGACVKAALSGASGGYVVGYVGNGSANYLQFNNVYVSTTGSYTLRIYYVSGAVRTASMSVNGGAGASISFPATGSGWTTVGSLTVTVNLNAGNNTIRFSNATAYAPDFDRIVVQ
jgi:alpha-galactosidase